MTVEGCKGLPVFGSVPYRTRVKFGRTRVRQVHFDTLVQYSYHARKMPYPTKSTCGGLIQYYSIALELEEVSKRSRVSVFYRIDDVRTLGLFL